MSLILALETSTKNCSVALAENGKLLSFRAQSSDGYIHAEMLHVFIHEVMQEAKVKFADLSGVAVGAGPGSYTGLRIGVSAAKGLCYTLNIPLISFNGLHILAAQFAASHSLSAEALIIPMIDARRMEVYTAVYNASAEAQTEIKPLVVDEAAFAEYGSREVYFIGDGAPKCKEVLQATSWHFPELFYPSALQLAPMTFAKLEAKQFEDTAYFEPFYLKEFKAGKPKKVL